MELEKFGIDPVQRELERWLKFLIEAETMDENTLPNWMNKLQHPAHAPYLYPCRQLKK
jgi:hypothetical protein